jgi:hypothetical protein
VRYKRLPPRIAVPASSHGSLGPDAREGSTDRSYLSLNGTDTRIGAAAADGAAARAAAEHAGRRGPDHPARHRDAARERCGPAREQLKLVRADVRSDVLETLEMHIGVALERLAELDQPCVCGAVSASTKLRRVYTEELARLQR